LLRIRFGLFVFFLTPLQKSHPSSFFFFSSPLPLFSPSPVPVCWQLSHPLCFSERPYKVPRPGKLKQVTTDFKAVFFFPFPKATLHLLSYNTRLFTKFSWNISPPPPQFVNPFATLTFPGFTPPPVRKTSCFGPFSSSMARPREAPVVRSFAFESYQAAVTFTFLLSSLCFPLFVVLDLAPYSTFLCFIRLSHDQRLSGLGLFLFFFNSPLVLLPV